ncbi:unnamed protein product [Camellia sinensis]
MTNLGAMSKLSSSLFHFRNQLSQRNLSAKDVRDALPLQGFMSRAFISTARETFSADGKFADRIIAPYSIYKGKAAFSATPVLPTFSKLGSGSLKVDRRGSIMLKFWPAIGERKYDWEKRQLFALSATEVGSLISLGSKDSCEFFHDPSMLSSNAGQVRKTLSVKPNDNGYFISLILVSVASRIGKLMRNFPWEGNDEGKKYYLGVVNNILKTNDRFSVPVTTAEFAVMRTAFSFALPHLMGWDRYTHQLPQSMYENPSSAKVVSPLLDSEWDK